MHLKSTNYIITSFVGFSIHIYTFRIVADQSSRLLCASPLAWVTGCKERDPLPIRNHTHLDMNFLFAPRPFTNSIKTSFWKSICKCSTLCASVVCARSLALFALVFSLVFSTLGPLFLFLRNDCVRLCCRLYKWNQKYNRTAAHAYVDYFDEIFRRNHEQRVCALSIPSVLIFQQICPLLKCEAIIYST